MLHNPPRRTPEQIAEDSRVRTTINRRHGNKGQPKAAAIRHRVALREVVAAKIEAVPEDGVDVTALVGFEDRHIGHECAWIHGDPLHPGSGFCGRPVKPGSSWCPEHHARVFLKVPAK